MSYDLRLGRLYLPTIFEGVKEPVGDQLDSVGAISFGGERAPRPFPLTLPVYASGPAGEDRHAVGLRLRRQLRSLLRNPKARLEGLYFNWSVDPELNGWLLIGRGEIVDGDGGITFADFKAELGDIVAAGSPRTHRQGRRLEARDRRLSTTPRDYRGTIFSTDFADQPALRRHWLPSGAYDVVGAADQAITAALWAQTAEGPIHSISGRPADEVISFEQAEADRHKGDVVVRNRPAEEEVYGPDYPLTSGDVPVVENGLCRVSYEKSRQAFILDRYVNGGWGEQGRATLWFSDASHVESQFQFLQGAEVVEWTPERAVVSATLMVGDVRCVVYVTLQRGWVGPRVEAYGAWGSGTPGMALRITPIGTSLLVAMSSGTSGPHTAAAINGVEFSTFAGLQPWAYLLPNDPFLPVSFGVLQTGVRMVGRNDSAAYNASKPAVSLAARFGTPVAGYVSATFRLGGGRATAAGDAQDNGFQNLYDTRAGPLLLER